MWPNPRTRSSTTSIRSAGTPRHGLWRPEVEGWEWEGRFYPSRYDRSCVTSRRHRCFAEHFWVCMIVDRYAIANRHLIGIDKLMWEADFPQDDSDFPDSRKLLEEACADVPDHEDHQIAELNARNFYDFH